MDYFAPKAEDSPSTEDSPSQPWSVRAAEPSPGSRLGKPKPPSSPPHHAMVRTPRGVDEVEAAKHLYYEALAALRLEVGDQAQLADLATPVRSR